MSKMTKSTIDFLQRLADGQRPLLVQVPDIGRRCEQQGLVKIDWGEGVDDRKMCVYITAKGRDALMRAK